VAEQALCQPFLTPPEEFFFQAGGRSTVERWAQPELAADTPIRVEGLVQRPLTLPASALWADETEHVTVLNSLMCVLGLRGTAIWTGVPLRLLLDRAGIDRQRARRVRFFGADGFENNLTLDDIYDNPDDLFEPLLAFRIAGQALPRELGFPVRLLLNDRYGYKNTKWLTRIEVTQADEATGQYQDRGYPDAGVMEAVPMVESHLLTQTIPAGRTQLCGFALSGHAPIESVELSLDGGPAQAASQPSLQRLLDEYPELATTLQLQRPGTYPLRGVWVVWSFEFDATPGEHSVAVWTHDTAGNRAQAPGLRLSAV